MALRHALFLALLVTCSAATGHSGLPGERLSKLRELLSSEPHPIRILETHSGLTGLIAETADVGGKQFHGKIEAEIAEVAASIAGGSSSREPIPSKRRRRSPPADATAPISTLAPREWSTLAHGS